MQKQVIEYAGVPVGIAIPDRDQLRFIAVKYHVIGLDDRRFGSVEELRNTIRSHLSERQHLAA